MEDREVREQFRRAYKVFGVMQRKMQAEGVKASTILRKMANILEIVEDHPEHSLVIIEALEDKWL